MALLLKMVYQSYSDFVEKNAEPQLDDYFLMGSPLKAGAVTVLYYLFVMKYGPKWMENRQPFDLKYPLLAFNALQVIVNSYFVHVAGWLVFKNPDYSNWSCMQRSRPADSYELLGCYLFYMLKISDYMDTIFMVLRKRNRQITFLHVYHHILMVWGLYYVARFQTGGHTVMLGFVNGSVHVIMYAYYFLAALRPGLRESVSWKKHITHLQLTQFCYLIYHFSRAFFDSGCDQPKGLMFFCLMQSILMFVLFVDFYYKAYCKPMKNAKTAKQKQ